MVTKANLGSFSDRHITILRLQTLYIHNQYSITMQDVGALSLTENSKNISLLCRKQCLMYVQIVAPFVYFSHQDGIGMQMNANDTFTTQAAPVPQYVNPQARY